MSDEQLSKTTVWVWKEIHNKVRAELLRTNKTFSEWLREQELKFLIDEGLIKQPSGSV